MAVPIYIGYYFKITPLQPAVDILIAELGNVGFESFVETVDGVHAYVQKEAHTPTMLDEIYVLQSNEFDITYTSEEIEQVNWNEAWEKNFTPILVDDICSVRAPFHEKLDVPYDIVIEPKMSFGTGHHETTHMMIQHLLTFDMNGKRVLDMGCGTGILAILAAMRGARTVDAIDIDEWCYLNTVENITRNQYPDIKVYEGDASLLSGKIYDVIIANINRNILLNDMERYVQCLQNDGVLFLSGFYKEDLEMITEACAKYGLFMEQYFSKNDWIAARYQLK